MDPIKLAKKFLKLNSKAEQCLTREDAQKVLEKQRELVKKIDQSSNPDDVKS